MTPLTKVILTSIAAMLCIGVGATCLIWLDKYVDSRLAASLALILFGIGLLMSFKGR